ncbi:hypothetical protein FHS29_003956 [Saccharothrix tamanrassetensis]|uniref:DUF2975 domain-containing protein n=1 Tax=Saccharothrix tamanrassetensis TaxID=1051531 RepID=A0A841CIU4_9PSEU|nr:DUF2975 domain-containing protein [Saccharothrix tamanrassetensis]MBB5957361.1 hypothetical protein [Saccharothrix tamanrassetensis]
MKNPLQPLTSLVRFLWSITAVLVAGGAVLRAVYTVQGSVCFKADSAPSPSVDGSPLYRDTVTAYPEVVQVCIPEPTIGDRLLGILESAPSAFAYAGTFLLLMLLLEKAAKEGIHTVDTAQRLTRFGVYLLIALPVTTLVEAVARTVLLLDSVTLDLDPMVFVSEWHLPAWAVVTGLGMLSLGAIMRTSASMREELEGTV